MSQTFNPVTRTISKVVPVTNPLSLQTISRNAILQAVTLKRINQADELLPLPKPLVRTVSVLNLNDFRIDAERIEAGNHDKQSYNAKCVFDGRPCIIKLKSKGNQLELDNPSLITSFEENDTICCIYEITETLEDKIKQCKTQNTKFREAFIWHVIKAILDIMLKGKVTTSTKLNSSLVHFDSNGIIFLEVDDQTIQMGMGSTSAIYEAPEVLKREEETLQSFSWTIGCFIYEMLALEPAFYDRTGTNPFQVFMDMMQGIFPPEPPNGSREMKSVLWRCLMSNPDDRITPDELIHIAETNLENMF